MSRRTLATTASATLFALVGTALPAFAAPSAVPVASVEDGGGLGFVAAGLAGLLGLGLVAANRKH